MWEKLSTLARDAPIRWVLLALGGLAVILWLRYAPPTAPWSPRSIAGYVLPEPQVITKIERVEVPGPARIRIIPKEKIVVKYRDLPTPATVSDNATVVTAVADVPPSPDGGVAVAVLHTGGDNVGVGSIEYRPAQPKFLQVKKEFGVRVGMGTGGLIAGELYVRPLRLGPINVEARGFAHRTDRAGADFGGAVFLDYKF